MINKILGICALLISLNHLKINALLKNIQTFCEEEYHNIETIYSSKEQENAIESYENKKVNPSRRIANFNIDDGNGGGVGSSKSIPISYPIFYESEDNDYPSVNTLPNLTTNFYEDNSLTISGTIHMNKFLWFDKTTDVDYFEFNLPTKTNIQIGFNQLPSGCKYGVEIYNINNDSFYVLKTEKDYLCGSYTSSTNSYFLNRSLDAGFYYLKIYSYDGTYNNDSNYLLTIKTSCGIKDESISSLRFNKNAGGALWLSDRKMPLSLDPFSSYGKHYVGSHTFEASSSQTEDAYMNNPNYSSGHWASIYIWDRNLKIEILNIVKKTINDLDAKCEDNDELIVKIDKTETIVKGVSVVTRIALTFIAQRTSAEVAKISLSAGAYGVAIIAGVISLAIGFFSDVIKKDTSSKLTYKQYLIYLQGLLTFDQSKPDNGEVIKIDSYCSYDCEAQTQYVNQRTYKWDYSAYLDLTDLRTPTKYANDIIYGEDSDGICGRIYPIVDSSDYTNGLAGETKTFSDVNTGGNTKLSLGSESGKNGFLQYGEYHWYNFTAPITANYIFKTVSDTDTYGELFSSIVPGKSTSNLISSNDDGGDGNNFSISYKITAGVTVYLRVRGYNWTRTGAYYILAKYA